MDREPSVEDLAAEARYAARKVSVYKQRMYAGTGQPRRLAELQRIAAGAAERLERAQARRDQRPTG